MEVFLAPADFADYVDFFCLFLIYVTRFSFSEPVPELQHDY